MRYQPSGKHQTPSPPPSLFQTEDGEGEGDFYVQNMENKLRRVQRARQFSVMICDNILLFLV